MKLTAKNVKEEIAKLQLPDDLMSYYNDGVRDMLEFYGEDADLTETIDLWLEKANAYLAKNEKPAAQPQKPETKEDKQKKEPKNDETRPEPKKEPEKPKTEPKSAEKPKTAPKSEEKPAKDGKKSKKKAPAALFKTGAWVIDNKADRAGIISERLSYDDERGWLYHVEYVGSKELTTVAEKDLSRTRAPRTVANTGELVPELSAEIRIISRYVALHGKKYGKVADEMRKILAALQKMIINKQIRKTSKYAKEINAMQDSLIKAVNGKHSASEEIDIKSIDALRKIVARQNVTELSNISRSFVALIGKDGQKAKAKALYESILKHDFKGSDSAEAETMKKALRAYIDDETETVYATARELQGIFGLAGIL